MKNKKQNFDKNLIELRDSIFMKNFMVRHIFVF